MMEQVSEAKIQVVVADDHPIVCSGISTQLNSQPDIVVQGSATNGNDAVRLTRTLAPNVLVLDVNMPGLKSVDVLEQVQMLPSPPYVLILTAHNDMEHVLALLKAGAKGYMLKDEEPTVISVAVRAVAQGKTWISPAVMANMVAYSTRDLAKSDSPDLSAREIEVLRLLAEGRDNQEIGDMLTISERTVRYHLRNIYDKLGVRRRSAAMAWAIRQRLGEP